MIPQSGSLSLPCLAALLFAPSFAIAETAQHPAPTEKALYETRLQEIEEQYANSITNLATKYTQALEKSAAELQKKGDLDGLLAMKKEIARFKSVGKVPESSPADAPATVKNYQKIYREASAEAVATRHESVTKLTASYQTHLESLQKKLTQEGKIEEAILIKKEADALSAFKDKIAEQGQAAGLDAEKKNTPSSDVAGKPSVVAWDGRKISNVRFSHEGGNTQDRDAILLKGGKSLVNGFNDKLLESCKESSELTLEVDFETESLKQSGPARIFSFSLNGTQRNFSLCQENDELTLRLRTTKTGDNGTNPEVKLGKIKQGQRHQIRVSYKPGKLTCSIDGKEQKVQQIDGDFSNWQEHQIVLGNEWKDDRPWKGRIYAFAVYPKAID